MFDPKFNIVSPGADAEVYFPYTQEDKRLKQFHSELKELLYGSPEKGKSVGQLKSKDKPIIFRLEFGSTFSVVFVVYFQANVVHSMRCIMMLGSGSSYGQCEDEEDKSVSHSTRCAEVHAVGLSSSGFS